MKEITARDWVKRILIGGLCGWVMQLLIASFFASLDLIGGSSRWHWDFSLSRICENPAVPEILQDLLTTALMFLFGAEIGLSTLPFSEYGGRQRPATLLHFAATMLTVGAFGWVTSGWHDLVYWMVAAALIYVLIWLGRWVSWYVELEQIKEKLGIASKSSPLKWRETLPHIGFAFLLCSVLPLVLRAFDPADIPLVSVFFAWLLMLLGGFVTGVSLGKRQGFCPLYPLVCGVFSLAIFPFALTDRWLYPAFAFFPALLGNLLGCAFHKGSKWTKREQS